MYSKSAGGSFHCYSINGEPLSEATNISGEIVSPIVVRDSLFSDYLVYIVKQKSGQSKLVKRKLPTLEEESVPCEEGISVLAGEEGQRFVLAGYEDGRIGLFFSTPDGDKVPESQ